MIFGKSSQPDNTNALMLPIGLKHIRGVLLRISGATEDRVRDARTLSLGEECKSAAARVYAESNGKKDVEYVRFDPTQFSQTIAMAHEHVRRLILDHNATHPVRLFETPDMVRSSPES